MARESDSNRLSLGAEGERLAADHLEREGYRIVGRNVRAGGVEIDLIAARGRLRVFVEVKTRRSHQHGPPEEAVDARKQARIARGATAWLREQGSSRMRIRFDVIAIDADPSAEWRIRHWRAAFDAPSSP